jgi:hypothetical protein
VEALCDCIKDCYGDTYCADEFNDPKKIKGLLRKELLHSIIAVSSDGKIVGHLGTSLEQIGDITAEGSAGMVRPGYRGCGILPNLGMKMVEVYKRLNLIGVQTYAIAVHPIIQEKSLAFGASETGILLAHLPAGTQISGFTHTYKKNRLAAVAMYLPFEQAPEKTVYLPKRYYDIITGTYNRLKLKRTIKSGHRHKFSKKTTFTLDKKMRWGIEKISIQEIGHDLIEKVSTIQQVMIDESFPVLYVDIPLWHPVCPDVAEKLHSLCFFYGGIVIERGDSDILRMQFLTDKCANPETISLVSAFGKKLLDFTLHDRSCTMKNT